MKRRRTVVAVMVLLCGAAVLVGLAAGAAGWRGNVVSRLWAGDEIVTTLRAPRVLLGALTGASLALAGVCMQAALRNDLADPYVLGMAGGASAGALVSLAVLPSLPPGPAAAGGAALATALVRGVTRGPDRLVLAGVAVSAVLGSISGLVLILAPGERLLRSATYWLFGGFGTPGPAGLVVPAVALLVAFAVLHRRAERLDRLVLGDDVAASLGTDPRRLRGLALAAGVGLTASAVAAGGLIGFVGLIAPHAARRLVGPGHRGLLPVAALLGALVVMLADTMARTAFAPREVPLGLITALLGGPFFLWLLGRRAEWGC